MPLRCVRIDTAQSSFLVGRQTTVGGFGLEPDWTSPKFRLGMGHSLHLPLQHSIGIPFVLVYPARVLTVIVRSGIFGRCHDKDTDGLRYLTAKR